MKSDLTATSFSIIALICIPTMAHAQAVEVAPGYVRAPFVRVYRTPDGRTHVRAPFVNVESELPNFLDGPVADGPVAPIQQPPGPSLQPTREPTAAHIDVTEMNEQTLKQTVQIGESELERQLSGYPQGARWKQHLHVGRISQLEFTNRNQRATDQERVYLQQILDRYDRSSTNPAFRPVTRLAGFTTVHAALAELLLPPQERQRGQLAMAAVRLDESLARIQNGEHWSAYLRLPSQVFAPVVIGQNERLAEELASVLDRFDSVQRQPQYRTIVNLSAFQITHRRLASYIDLLDGESNTQIEELPPPPAEPIIPQFDETVPPVPSPK